MGTAQTRGGSTPSYFGVYPAIVTGIEDPDDLGRVEVRLPAVRGQAGGDLRLWATLCTPYADDEQGLLILPEVGSQVVVAFEAGNLRRPYVVGCTWSGRSRLPQPPRADNDIRLLRTRGGSRLEFDDAPSGPKISLTTESGHRIVLDEATSEVTITHSGGSNITLTAAGNIEITASSATKVRAPVVVVESPVARFSGVVECETLIARSGVVSPSYTPGVGNIW